MVGTEIVHIAVAPVEILDDNLIGNVAAILGKDFYNTRLLLAGKMPKLIAHFNSRGEAGEVAAKFKTLNLKPMIFEDAALRKLSESFFANLVEMDSGKITLRDHEKQSVTLTGENCFLMLKGIISTSRETAVTASKIKINVPLTVLSGGIPIVRRVQEQQKETTHREEYFLRIYSRDSADRNIEILQNDFDYSFLGSRMSFASSTNFNLLQNDIREHFPQMIFDDKLTRFSNPTVTSNTLNNIEVNCKLLFAWYQLNSLNQ